MADSSFDIVSKLDHQEVDNALGQTAREIATRFDFTAGQFISMKEPHDGREITRAYSIASPPRGSAPQASGSA